MGPREKYSLSFLFYQFTLSLSKCGEKRMGGFFGGCSSKAERPVVNGTVAGAVPVSHPRGKYMKNTKQTNLKIAVQKNGRLSEETLLFLRKSGLEFESYNKRLLCECKNFPLEILYVRDDDIAGYVSSGIADLGIMGQNLLYETRPDVKKLLNLRFGACALTIAIPKDSSITSITELNNATIATSYPNSTRAFLKKNNITATIITLSGSVEIAPTLGIATAISDLRASGSTLAVNDLRPLETIYSSEAVLIMNKDKKLMSSTRNAKITELLGRFLSVLSAKNYKYISMNVPENNLRKLLKLTAGLASSTNISEAAAGQKFVQTVMTENRLWETVEKLKALGVSKIIVTPIEKIIS